MSASRRGSSSLIHTSPRMPQMPANIVEVRPPHSAATGSGMTPKSIDPV